MNEFNHDDLMVITLGGNAVLPVGTSGTINEQFVTTRSTMAHVAALSQQGARVVLSHGNGPVVGNILIRNEAAREEITPMPLFICGADSQGGLGFMLQNALLNEFHLAGDDSRAVTTIVTQVEVDPEDPAFANPSKPIGPFYSADEATSLESEKGWVLKEDAGRGWRRVVPSPEPQSIIEIDSIRHLVEQGVIVIAAGGGGIPVRRNHLGLLKGVDAVIDKDFAATVLCRQLGATHLIFVTSIDAVAVNFGRPDQRDLGHITLAELESHQRAGEFAAGSMGPKMEAARRFLVEGGKQVLVCSTESMGEALAGRAGTSIIREEE